MIGYFTANGKSSADFNVILSDAYTYGKAERDQEFISVPGRSGDLLIDHDRYKNKTYKYQCIIHKDFDVNFSAFVGFLQSQKGYMRMEDTFHPDEYVLARYVGEVDPKRVHRDRIGSFEMQFNRKPQRWLKNGEKPLSFTSTGEIINNYFEAASPLIRAYGTGTLNIGSQTITITAMASGATYTDIDCEMQDAYFGTTNCNGNIVLGSSGFPKLLPGSNGITFTGLKRVDITPRWWRL